ncbi:MAG TPA: DUF899 family protein [Dongiaceae bacterium]|nr:DUF899 family protein [Dongiaceae bacterium]
MSYRDDSAKLAAYRQQIAELRKKMREIQSEITPEPVADYEFATAQGKVRLSTLFGDKDTLILIHNMGTGCVACTLWADGFNGVFPHLQDRAAFVVSSPDEPATQQRFAADRGWRFPMISHQGTSFAADMGYAREGGKAMPGLSVFKRKDGEIMRVADTGFRPGDDFCSVWHILDMMPEGSDGWMPKYRYAG